MNIIVANKYKDLIYSTNIEILKELTGVYKVGQIANSFKSIFYRKIIIDATALENFPKENVLKELVSTFDADKLILLLPPDNAPPKRFLSFLVSIGLYNFTDNPKGLFELTTKSNTYDDVKEFLESVSQNISKEPEENFIVDTEFPKQVIIGFRSITDNSYITELIYMLKRTLDEKYKKDVVAVEINKRDFGYYNYSNMYSISQNNLSVFLQNNSGRDIILIDLNNINTNECTDLINLINPSIYTINKLLYHTRDALIRLKGEKVVLVNSLLSENDVNQFSKEAGINIYYNLPPVNDRTHSNELDKLLNKLGIVNAENRNAKKGLLDLFK